MNTLSPIDDGLTTDEIDEINTAVRSRTIDLCLAQITANLRVLERISPELARGNEHVLCLERDSEGEILRARLFVGY